MISPYSIFTDVAGQTYYRELEDHLCTAEKREGRWMTLDVADREIGQVQL